MKSIVLPSILFFSAFILVFIFVLVYRFSPKAREISKEISKPTMDSIKKYMPLFFLVLLVFPVVFLGFKFLADNRLTSPPSIYQTGPRARANTPTNKPNSSMVPAITVPSVPEGIEFGTSDDKDSRGKWVTYHLAEKFGNMSGSQVFVLADDFEFQIVGQKGFNVNVQGTQLAFGREDFCRLVRGTEFTVEPPYTFSIRTNGNVIIKKPLVLAKK